MRLLSIHHLIDGKSKICCSDSSKVYGVLHNWEASLYCGIKEGEKGGALGSSQCRGAKFNVDGAAKGKPGPAGIDGVLCDSGGFVLIRFQSMLGLWSRMRRRCWLS